MILTDKVDTGDGNFIYRPKGQDIKPKAFKFPAIHMIALYEVPTERRLLWMIANYPYIFNTFFIADFIAQYPQAAKNHDSKFQQASRLMHSLEMKGFINRDDQNGKCYITFTGYLFRVTTYPGFPLIATVIGCTAITIAILNLNKKSSTPIIIESAKPKTEQDSTKLKNDSSVLYNPVRTDSGKVRDSFLKPNDTTKTSIIHK